MDATARREARATLRAIQQRLAEVDPLGDAKPILLPSKGLCNCEATATLPARTVPIGPLEVPRTAPAGPCQRPEHQSGRHISKQRNHGKHVATGNKQNLEMPERLEEPLRLPPAPEAAVSTSAPALKSPLAPTGPYPRPPTGQAFGEVWYPWGRPGFGESWPPSVGPPLKRRSWGRTACCGSVGRHHKVNGPPWGTVVSCGGCGKLVVGASPRLPPWD